MNARPTKPGAHQHRSGFAYGTTSIMLFGLALVLFLLTSTVFDGAFGNYSLNTQRWIAVITLIVPTLLGAVAGIFGLMHGRQAKRWSIIGLVLNTLFLLFVAAVLAIAG